MLGFALSEEQEAFRHAVRALAEGMLAPQVEELEAKEEFPLAVFRELGRLGYLGVGVPETEGGSGGDTIMRALLLEEIACETYKRPGELLRLAATAIVENFGYHQLVLLWRLQGFYQWITRAPARWGEMKRTATWRKTVPPTRP